MSQLNTGHVQTMNTEVTQEQIQFHQDNGYLLVEEFFSSEECLRWTGSAHKTNRS
jgi:hypothetical protein